MGVTKFSAEGFADFQTQVADLQSKFDTVLVLFSGTKDSDGRSWCPDCVVAEPVVGQVVDAIRQDNVAYLYVGVGDRAFWKDPNCIFRTDDKTKLKSVPTLIKWGTPQRLEEANVAKKDMVEMLLED